jgi:hypothetical protein
MSALLGKPRPRTVGRKTRHHPYRLAAAAAIAVLVVATSAARAAGGHYAFVGGTPAERAGVTAALDASRFDWSLVPETVTIRLQPDQPTAAIPGTILLDSNLVDAGRFAWGPIQHEYAHEVDFFLLDPATRAVLRARLGGVAWLEAGVPHDDLAGERFADALTWAYWPSPDDVTRPPGEFAPTAFRSLLTGLLAQRTGL